MAVVRDLSEREASEQRPGGSEAVSHTATWMKTGPDVGRASMNTLRREHACHVQGQAKRPAWLE